MPGRVISMILPPICLIVLASLSKRTSSATIRGLVQALT
jgi:hypothetical protein